MLLAALQIRHFIFFARAFIFNARVKGALSRGAHVNLEAHRVVDFSVNPLDGTQVMSMRLKKVCPQCDATLHVRKLACPCGHVFPAKAQQMGQTCQYRCSLVQTR